MPTCPQCGEHVAFGEQICGACGGEVPTTSRRRVYLGSAGALAAIVIAAALLHSFLQTRVLRSPTDFLPPSTHVAIGLDLRPESPAMKRIELAWPASDAKALAGRATELAQKAVDWSGIQLDLGTDASNWFGGEVVVASVTPSRLRALAPRSAVVIARVTDLRRARHDLDESVAEMAREGGWERSAVRAEGHTIVAWGHPDGRSEIAYATLDGCALVSASEDVVRRCIESAMDSEKSLTETADFVETTRPLPSDAFLWCYAAAPDLIGAARTILPQLGHGWLGLARAFLRLPAASDAETGLGDAAGFPGGVALALTPESDGVRLHANYWAGKERELSALSPESAELLDLVPREAVAFALVRGIPELVAPLLPNPNHPEGAADVFVSQWYPWVLRLTEGSLPEALLVTALPKDGKAGEVSLVTAFTGPDSEGTARRLKMLMPRAETAVVSDAQVFAWDAKALKRIETASQDEAARLGISTQSDVSLQGWARPGELWPRLEKLGDVGFQVRSQAQGAQIELSVKAEPRYLLGGD